MIQRLLPFFALIALFVILAVVSPNFLTATNLASVVRQTTVINILALGMTMVIITGGIDLSVGSNLALAGLLGSMAMARYGIPAGLVAGLITGALCGLANGAMITGLRISPFIVTLGAMGIYRGLALIVSKGLPVSDIPPAYSYLAEGTLARVPFALWILAACAVVVHVILEHTRLGRYAFSIGSNPDAAYYAGVPVRFHTTAVYTIAGLLAGLAGMIETSRLMTGQPTSGQGYELTAIAAVVIGGGSLRGGEGTVLGTLMGALIMGLLANGSDLLGTNPYWQQVIIGGVIILAVALDELRKRRTSA
jgi:ribose transport system permease protein